jgi:hypothetical protein
MGMFITITCPHCQQDFDCQMDADGSSEFIVDCEICCRPMTVQVRLQNGELEELRVTPA